MAKRCRAGTNTVIGWPATRWEDQPNIRSAAGLKAHYAALVAALQTETRRGTGTG
jgi:hypothetical protein